MAEVVSINGREQTVATAVNADLADDLELLAKRIRLGEVDAHRAMMVFERHDTCLDIMALGPGIKVTEASGMFARAVHLVWES
jgi:hypothetical protein